jgi:hypothetical protein
MPLWLAARDSRTFWYAKLLALVTAAYAHIVTNFSAQNDLFRMKQTRSDTNCASLNAIH